MGGLYVDNTSSENEEAQYNNNEVHNSDTVLLNKYSKIYLENETYDYLINTVDSKSVFNSYLTKKNKNLAKKINEIAVSALICSDIDSAIMEIEEMDKVEGIIAEESISAYRELCNNCGEDIDRSETCRIICKELDRLKKLKNDLVVKNYFIEKSMFKKITGYNYYLEPESSYLFYYDEYYFKVYNSLSNILCDRNLIPKDNYLYGLSDMTVFQVLDDGVLLEPIQQKLYSSRMAFLYTKNKYVDNQNLNSGFSYYSGSYKYISISGVRTVYAFKMSPYDGDHVVKGKQFYFYPTALNITESNEKKVISDAFGVKI